MEFNKLPPVKTDMTLAAEHFPDRFHAAVFRLWKTVDALSIARATATTVDVVEKAATDMGLPKQKYTDKWAKLGYITTICNAWHILPYEQLLALLGWEEEKLATIPEDILIRSTNHGVDRYKIMPEFLP